MLNRNSERQKCLKLRILYRAGVSQYRLCYGLDDRGSISAGEMMGFFFLLATASRPALRPTQSPLQWVVEVFTPGLKRLGREADHLPPPSAEFKNAWSYTSTPQYVFMAWCLIMQEINLNGMVLS
jgi:hypothetical protein